jgi:hypothetical protein
MAGLEKTGGTRRRTVLLVIGALPMLLFILFIRIMIIWAWPHPEQDQCSFSPVTQQEYLDYRNQARRRIEETRAGWKATHRIDGEYYLPRMIVNEIVPLQPTWSQKLAATHAIMRELGGVLVDEMRQGDGDTYLIYRIVVPDSFPVACLTRCYAIESLEITNVPKSAFPGAPKRIDGGTIRPGLIGSADTTKTIRLFDAAPRCPVL